MATLRDQWLSERGIAPQAQAPTQQPQSQPQDNGLLSLIPFYDIGQKLLTGRGNEITAGEVLLETGLTFLPFGKIAKGASMLAKGAQKAAGGGLEQALKGTAPGLVNAGSRIRGFGRDIRPGAKLPGTTDPLDAKQAQTINAAIDSANTGRPRIARGQLMGVQGDLKTKGKELGDLTNKFNRPLTPADGDEIGRLVEERRSNIVGFDPVKNAGLNNRYADRVAKAKDLKALEKERKNFDEEAKRLLSNPNAKGTLGATLARAYRDAIDKYVAGIAPELKVAKSGYRGLSQGEDLLARGSTLKPEVKTPIFGGPLPFAGNAKQVGSEALGKTLQAIGGSSPLARVGRNAAGQVGRRAVVDPLIAAMSGSQAVSPETAPDALQGALGPSTLSAALSGDADATANPQSPYPLQNLLQDIQRDPANREEYLATYQMYQDLLSPNQGPDTKLTAGQQSMAVRAQNALGDIDTIAQAIDSGSIDRGLVPFSDNSLIGNALGIGDVNAALYNLGDVILRSRTGSAAPESEVNKFIAGYLPRAGESLETKRYKLQRAFNELRGMINPPGALGTGTAVTLQDALAG